MSRIIDIQGSATSDDYQLTKSDYLDWMINKIIKTGDLNQYLSETSKQLDESTPFWKFLKKKYPKQYDQIKQGSKHKVNHLMKTDSKLIKSMSFDEIAAIYLTSTSTVGKDLDLALDERKDEWTIFCIPLISGVSKLPFIWIQKPLYRGLSNKIVVNKARSHDYCKGAILRWGGCSYNVVTESLDIATRFAGPTGVVFEIVSSFKGRRVNKFS
eukprot:398309_1